jgi:hypothetical protein
MSLLRVFIGVLLAVSLAGQAWSQPQTAARKPANAARSGPAVTMHKCVDAAGKVYYSDRLAAECPRSSELTRQGVTVERKPPAGTAGQATSPKKAAATPQSAAQERRDKALIATYTSEQEIDLARDRNLQIPLQAVKLTESRIGRLDKELEGLNKQADALTSKQKPVPAQLTEELGKKQSARAALQSELAQKSAHAESIRQKYESDKQRYRELQGLASR